MGVAAPLLTEGSRAAQWCGLRAPNQSGGRFPGSGLAWRRKPGYQSDAEDYIPSREGGWTQDRRRDAPGGLAQLLSLGSIEKGEP